jgi:ankyrin repeat protein
MLSDDTLLEKYLSDTTDDKGALKFICSEKCTKAMINYDEYDGWTPLCLTARLNRYEVVQALINKGADVSYVHSDTSYSALAYCLTDGAGRDDDEQDKTIDILLKAGAPLEYTTFNQIFNLFTLACRVDNLQAAKKFLEYHPEININVIDYHEDEDGNYKTPLEYATEYGNQELVELINAVLEKRSLEKGVNLSHNDSKKNKL